MPFKSEAQRKKFHQMAKEGLISKSMVDKWEKETPNKPLPERAPKPLKVKKVRKI